MFSARCSFHDFRRIYSRNFKTPFAIQILWQLYSLKSFPPPPTSTSQTMPNTFHTYGQANTQVSAIISSTARHGAGTASECGHRPCGPVTQAPAMMALRQQQCGSINRIRWRMCVCCSESAPTYVLSKGGSENWANN